MKIKKDKIDIKIIKKGDYHFLYELLSKRKQIFNISHKKMPTYKQHVKFVDSQPYSKWYIVYYNDLKVGSVYLSKQNEIGIHLIKDVKYKILYTKILKKLMKKNSKRLYFINVNPNNKKTINLVKKNGFILIQQTYGLIN